MTLKLLWILLFSFFVGSVEAEEYPEAQKRAGQLQYLLDRASKGEHLDGGIEKELQGILSVCLSTEKAGALLNVINEQFRSGNPGGALGFFVQKYRISTEALSLENQFNEVCQEVSCRQRLIQTLKVRVPDDRAYQILFEAQFYPRVFHIENIPGVKTQPYQPKGEPEKLAWMTPEYHAAEVRQWREKNPSYFNDYFIGETHQWREAKAKRTFPRTEGFQVEGTLLKKGAKYFEYSFCDDEQLVSYSPNYWVLKGEKRIGLKTYLGCHGRHLFQFSGAHNLKCGPNPKVCGGDGFVPSQFPLTREESSCFQRRLFNPQPSVGLLPLEPLPESLTVPIEI